MIVLLAGCSSSGKTADPVTGGGDASSEGGPTDGGSGGAKLPIDPTGLCPMPSGFPRGSFLLAPSDMDAVVPVPPNELTMIVIEEGALIDASVIELAASRLTLQAWPDGPPLAVTTRIERPGGGDPRTRIALQPKSALPDGWFVFRIVDPPPELTRYPPWSVHPVGARGLETRFHTASFPILSWVRICNSGGGAMVFHLEHSQNLAWTAPLDSIFSFGQSGASPKCAIRDARTSGSRERLQFECTSVADDGAITIETKAGLSSLDGVPVAPAKYTFTLAELPRLKDNMVFQNSPP